jgi:hypothetical protein
VQAPDQCMRVCRRGVRPRIRRNRVSRKRDAHRDGGESNGRRISGRGRGFLPRLDPSIVGPSPSAMGRLDLSRIGRDGPDLGLTWSVLGEILPLAYRGHRPWRMGLGGLDPEIAPREDRAGARCINAHGCARARVEPARIVRQEADDLISPLILPNLTPGRVASHEAVSRTAPSLPLDLVPVPGQ